MVVRRGVANSVATSIQLVAHHRIEPRPIREDLEQLGDRFGELAQLIGYLVAAKRGEAVQPQVEDRADLGFGQLIGVAAGLMLDRLDQGDIGRDVADRPFAREQGGARLDRARRGADQPDDLVEIGHRDDKTKQDVGTLACLEQLELGPPSDDLFAEGDEGGDEILEAEHLGLATAQREHVRREAALRRGVPPELVEHHLGCGIALQLDDDADAVAVGLVADVGDTFDPLVLRRLGDLFDQAVLADLIGDFGEHDLLAVAALVLDLVARAHDDRALAGMIGVARAALAEDQPAGREIRAGDDLDEFVDLDQRIVDIGQAGGDHLAEVVRRDVGRHADGDAAGAVDQNIGKARRQDLRLALGAVVIVDEGDRVLVEVLEQVIGDLGQPRLGIAHRRRRIGVHRAEIALAVDQRHPHRPILGEPGQRLVDRGIAMGVKLTHDVADDAAAFAQGPAGDIAGLMAGVENAAMDRLEAVADVGQRPRDDHRHRIVEIGGLHLVDDRDGRDVGWVDDAWGVGQENSPVMS